MFKFIIPALIIAAPAFAGGEKECPFINSGDYANAQIEQSCGAHTKTYRGLRIVIVSAQTPPVAKPVARPVSK